MKLYFVILYDYWYYNLCHIASYSKIMFVIYIILNHGPCIAACPYNCIFVYYSQLITAGQRCTDLYCKLLIIIIIIIIFTC